MANLNDLCPQGGFSWDALGNLEDGREQLGDTMPVLVYRLMEFTMKETLQRRFGKEECAEIFRDAGRTAGVHFTKNVLDVSLGFGKFVEQLQQVLKDLKIGVLRIESIDEDGKMVITVSEDLDCSGLPIMGEAVCNYDEGFLEGILGEYGNKEYKAIEVDCWAKGDRVCRFNVEEKK